MSRDVAGRPLELLCRLTGRADASFHEGQAEAVNVLVQDRQRVLVVQRTGWGKSALYLVATRLMRDRGAGPTLLVSPLLGLMRNQIDAAARLGLRAETVNSENRDRWDEVEAAIGRDEVDLLLISAQRLANREFQRDLLPVVGRRNGLLVVDEADAASATGGTTSIPTIGGSAASSICFLEMSRSWRARRPRTIAWSPTSRASSATAW